jgi:endonuclease/exonuclease/phosphatase family metal-dependent hydrolase
VKIATWNIERLKHKAQLEIIRRKCEQVDADILVLTETDNQVYLNYDYCFQTAKLNDNEPVPYKPSENRVSIFSNYKCVRQHPTFDEHTAVCVELETERGNLLVYGTIIGVYGNRHASFAEDLTKQLADIERLTSENHNICICGDFNCSFADNYYYTKAGRDAILASFAKNSIVLLTKNTKECIDHIAISESYVANSTVKIDEWNSDKKLSDHTGIVANLSELTLSVC